MTPLLLLTLVCTSQGLTSVVWISWQIVGIINKKYEGVHILPNHLLAIVVLVTIMMPILIPPWSPSCRNISMVQFPGVRRLFFLGLNHQSRQKKRRKTIKELLRVLLAWTTRITATITIRLSIRTFLCFRIIFTSSPSTTMPSSSFLLLIKVVYKKTIRWGHGGISLFSTGAAVIYQGVKIKLRIIVT